MQRVYSSRKRESSGGFARQRLSRARLGIQYGLGRASFGFLARQCRGLGRRLRIVRRGSVSVRVSLSVRVGVRGSRNSTFSFRFLTYRVADGGMLDSGVMV